jgi:hypothetical protein
MRSGGRFPAASRSFWLLEQCVNIAQIGRGLQALAQGFFAGDKARRRIVRAASDDPAHNRRARRHRRRAVLPWDVLR